ncbi:MAG TPA: NAD(P)-dependent oxidoreductase [Coriobacteriia bacterium]|nr:NAD(P)-dependent oxidoreductase [Coriobacteriia bacterium]
MTQSRSNVAGTKVAFIGTGVMGASMAGHLMHAGCKLAVYNRTPAKAQPLVERGARWAGTPGEAAADADVVITMVGYPADVEAVYLGKDGIIAAASAGTLLIDMTTSSPQLAVRIAEAADAAGLDALDAPVSGGDIGARNATLTIMVGGSETAFARAEALLSVMGKSVILQGGPGAGQHTKMSNQVAVAGSMFASIEALAYARAAGLDPASVLQSIGGGAAASWSLENLAPRVLKGDFNPGFYVKHFVKDLRIALEAARAAGLELPALTLAEKLYARLSEAGGSELGTQALWLLYASEQERMSAGVEASATAED